MHPLPVFVDMYERDGNVYGLEEISPPVLLAEGTERIPEFPKPPPGFVVGTQLYEGKWRTYRIWRHRGPFTVTASTATGISWSTPIYSTDHMCIYQENCTKRTTMRKLSVRAWDVVARWGLVIGLDDDGKIYAERRLSLVESTCPHTGGHVFSAPCEDLGCKNYWVDSLGATAGIWCGTDANGQSLTSTERAFVRVAGRPMGIEADGRTRVLSPIAVRVGQVMVAAVPVLRGLGTVTIPDSVTVLVLLVLARRTRSPIPLPEWILRDLCVRICLPGHTRFIDR